MLKKLRLERFKNFQEAELILGSLTVLVGANASGKSNIRDAFRFLHGISRNYNLAEIFGEKWVEGGILQWSGIRGGTREVTFQGAKTFVLEVSFTFEETNLEREATYRIEVDPETNGKAPTVVAEHLIIAGQKFSIFEAESYLELGRSRLSVKGEGTAITEDPITPFTNYYPVVSQLATMVPFPSIRSTCQAVLKAFSSMRFLDFSSDAMRKSSLPGQTILGDRGENLSSILQTICESPDRKQSLLEWIQVLTPMDAKDFEFPSDFTGKVLLTLVEEYGQKTSAISASDGTLRFLATLAALLGPEPARFYFFEELDNGIHPTRLHLLLQLLEHNASQRNIQIVTTTHSPVLVGLLSPQSLKYVSLTYRLPARQDARIQRVVDLAGQEDVIKEHNLARLYESGWLEDAVDFMENVEASE